MNKQNIIKFSLLTILFIILGAFCFFCGYNTKKLFADKDITRQERQIKISKNEAEHPQQHSKQNIYPKEQTITFDEYLYDNSSDKKSRSRFNLYGEIEYKNKIVLNIEGVPLTVRTAHSTPEIKTVLFTEGVEPEAGCDTDSSVSGTLGCYMYFLGEGKKKNYWKSK